MKELTTISILLGILVTLTAFGYLWLWFILKRPEKWGAWVDKENDFWVRLSVVPPAFAERCKRREKGLLMKVMVGAIPTLGTLGLIVIAMIFGVFFLLKSGVIS